ncbi:MAG: nucleoside triphosphate pyrophosphohydrolase [Bacteroidota bacterium]
MKNTPELFQQLLDIMDKLRNGCPWDKKQTFETLRKLTIEETYELGDAILQKNMDEIKKELGDLLLHIVFYAKLGAEQNAFNINDVIEGICKKLIYRHPHVFSDTKVENAGEVMQNWEDLKRKEGTKSVLSGIPTSLPAMVKANRIQEKVRAVGFDWEKKDQIWDKIQEELGELKQEVQDENQQNIENEFGDLIFSIINAARLYEVDPESALERTNQKFMNRFKYLEGQTINKGVALKNMTLDDMNEIWNQSKKHDTTCD